MAVKPITNRILVQNPMINRAEERSMSDLKSSGISNLPGQTVPGMSSKNYAIKLKDLDTAFIGHIKNVMKIKVKEAGEMMDLPVMYGNEERWRNVRRRGVIRDRNGSLILPLLMLKRTGIVFNDLMPQSFDHDVKGRFIQVHRAKRYSKDNQYTQFNVQQGAKPVMESIVTGMPDYVNLTYEVIAWTQYTHQMNAVLEAFVEHENCYFGDHLNYRFLCLVDGGFNDASEVGPDTERSIRSTFSMTLKGYLIPEAAGSAVANRRFEASKVLTPGKIVFSEKIQ